MILCSCFAVSARHVDAAVAAGAADVDAVGASCDAGTGCGSCRERIAERLCLAGRATCGRCVRCAENAAGRAS